MELLTHHVVSTKLIQHVLNEGKVFSGFMGSPVYSYICSVATIILIIVQ